jgi:hypothetical protein
MKVRIGTLGDDQDHLRTFLISKMSAVTDLRAASDTVKNDGRTLSKLGARKGTQDRPPDCPVSWRIHVVECRLQLGIRTEAAHGPVVGENGRIQTVSRGCSDSGLAGSLQSRHEEEEFCRLHDRHYGESMAGMPGMPHLHR